MQILFCTQISSSGIGIVRGVWPAKWVTKYTEVKADCLDEQTLKYSDMPSILERYDIIVIHKASSVLLRVAEAAKQLGKKLVYDTDDHDDALYGEYYIQYFLQDARSLRDKIISLSDMITVTVPALARKYSHYGKPVYCIDNGYDIALDEYRIKASPYFDGLDGEWHKIVYGGSKGHQRDIEMFLSMGVIHELSDQRIDWYFYGVMDGPPRSVKVGNSTVRFLPGADISEYIKSFYFDASLMIAPLVIDDFNHCRSRIKPVESGIVGIPLVASEIESYKGFSDGTRCIENSQEAWVDTIHEYIKDKELRNKHGLLNRAEVLKNHTASKLTHIRLDALCS